MPQLCVYRLVFKLTTQSTWAVKNPFKKFDLLKEDFSKHKFQSLQKIGVLTVRIIQEDLCLECFES